MRRKKFGYVLTGVSARDERVSECDSGRHGGEGQIKSGAGVEVTAGKLAFKM